MKDLDLLCVNTLRTLAIDGVQKANSGHPGAPMGCAAMAYALWARHLRFDPRAPEWPDRDRFILSNGHASMLLYGLLHLTGYDLPMEQLKAFRQLGSITPGHPENFLTPGIEMTTGPLGQGFAHGVGFALAESQLAGRYQDEGEALFDHYTYAIVGDGDLMEGVTSEAASLAGHLGLGKLIYLFDDNHITIDGDTDLAFTEDVQARFESYGWHTLRVADGNDVDAIDAALTQAKAVKDRPSLLLIRTHIGYGSPSKQDTSAAHGSPLGAEEIKRTKAQLGWPEDAQFLVPDEVSAHMRAAGTRGADLRVDWEARRAAFSTKHPDAGAELTRRLSGALPDGWEAALPTFEASEKGLATRAASGKVIDALYGVLDDLIGGSADLAGSVKTPRGGTVGDYSAANPTGRNVFFGVREHAMGSICNGLALHGGFRPYGATFLVFSDYMRPAVRLGALERAKSVWIWTHDSIGLGEDGPTHQPIEHLAALRAIPDFVLLRPADANEVVEAWKLAITDPRPVGLVLTRQNVPTFDRAVYGSVDGVQRGGYVLRDVDSPQAILLASGSEVAIAMEASERLAARGVAARVVSMPSWRLFEDQPREYREAVLPSSIRARVAIEAGASLGWHRYVGIDGQVLALDHFGASAPAEELYQHFGLTPEKMVEATLELLEQSA